MLISIAIYDLVTLTYAEFEHVHLKQLVAMLGGVYGHGQSKCRSAAFVVLIRSFQANNYHFFAIFKRLMSFANR